MCKEYVWTVDICAYALGFGKKNLSISVWLVPNHNIHIHSTHTDNCSSASASVMIVFILLKRFE